MEATKQTKQGSLPTENPIATTVGFVCKIP